MAASIAIRSALSAPERQPTTTSSPSEGSDVDVSQPTLSGV